MGDFHDIGRYALSALWVFGLLAAFLWWLNKKRGVPFAKHLDKKIQILEVYPMGLKNKMMLVQVDDQRMLLSMNTQDIRTLHAWSTPSDVVSSSSNLPHTPSPAHTHTQASSQPIVAGVEGQSSHLESTSQS